MGFIKGIGPTELILVLAVVLLLFGGAKLPGLARSLGQSINEFKKGAQGGDKAKEQAPSVTAQASTNHHMDAKIPEGTHQQH